MLTFSALEIGTYFTFPGKQGYVMKCSIFGYRDPENTVLGEVQVPGDPEVILRDAV